MKITMNEAMWDRVVRIILGIALLYLGFGGVVSGWLGTALGIIGFVPLLTGLVGYCPLYSLLRISTKQG